MTFKHKSDCIEARIQLQKRSWNGHNGSGKTEFRAYCVGCGASVNITNELAAKWNEMNKIMPISLNHIL